MVSLILALVILTVILFALPEDKVVALHRKVRTTIKGWFDKVN